jgi:NAD(P)-dependent dehydrogenase (short-subunit alcohol dehydrogenase family)
MEDIPFDFTGHHVFVAGGSGGINFGIAQAFASAGARISLLSRSVDRVEAAARQLVAMGAQAHGMPADVRTPEAVEAAFAEATRMFGRIDVLVSGAAGNFLARALDMSPRAFRTVVDIDLLGSFNVLRIAHQHLRKPGACVIQISASQAAVATPYQVHVSAAKAGVDALTRGLALEWGAEGIRINSVIPGPIQDTEGLRRLAPTQQTRDAMALRVPLRRLGRVEDVSRVCLMLASDWGSYITGAVIPVDGGLFLTGPRDFSAAAESTRRER